MSSCRRPRRMYRMRVSSTHIGLVQSASVRNSDMPTPPYPSPTGAGVDAFPSPSVPPQQNVSPVIDPNVEPHTAHRLLALARAHVGSCPVRTARVGFSDLRATTNYSVTALLVAPPLVVLAEHRYGRNDEGLDVIQAFRLDKVVQFASANGQCFLVIDADEVDPARTGFHLEGPLLSLPFGTTALDILGY